MLSAKNSLSCYRNHLTTVVLTSSDPNLPSFSAFLQLPNTWKSNSNRCGCTEDGPPWSADCAGYTVTGLSYKMTPLDSIPGRFFLNVVRRSLCIHDDINALRRQHQLSVEVEENGLLWTNSALRPQFFHCVTKFPLVPTRPCKV